MGPVCFLERNGIMGLFETIRNVFSLSGTGGAMAGRAVQMAWLKKLVQDEKDKRDNAQRLLDWYNKATDEIKDYIRTAAKRTFDPEEVDNEWQVVIVNGVKRMINRVSMAYADPPDRVLIDANGDPIDDPKILQIYSDMFKGMDINKKMRECDRMASLFNTLHLEIVPRAGAIDWDLKLRPISFVVPDPQNIFKPLRFAYEMNLLDPDTLATRDGYVLWTPEKHVWVSEGMKEYGISLEDGSNPYSPVMPIVVIRKEEKDDYWGDPLGQDVVDAFEQMSLQVSNMWENLFMQTHGQPFGINLGLPEGTKLRTGPKKPIMVDGVSKDKIPPSLSFPKPDPDITKVYEACDWFLNITSGARGLPPGAWSSEEKDLSGYAKMIDNMELLEMREEELWAWADVEEDGFEKSKMVWNRWPQINGGRLMPDWVHLQVQFKPVSFPEDPTEKIIRVKQEIGINVNSPAHYLASERGMPLEQAIEEVKRISQINREIRAAGGSPDLSGLIRNQAVEPGLEGGND